jgi:NADH:ubiquinone oxidoreductase subunit 3 (subunit A)
VLSDYELIGLLFLFAIALPTAAIVAATFLGPRKPNPIKNDVYECGMETFGPSWVQFRIQYYIYALVFVVFDVELVLLFPSAAAFGTLPLFAVVEAVIFLVILGAALVYVWRKGALEWR